MKRRFLFVAALSAAVALIAAVLAVGGQGGLIWDDGHYAKPGSLDDGKQFLPQTGITLGQAVALRARRPDGCNSARLTSSTSTAALQSTPSTSATARSRSTPQTAPSPRSCLATDGGWEGSGTGARSLPGGSRCCSDTGQKSDRPGNPSRSEYTAIEERGQ